MERIFYIVASTLCSSIESAHSEEIDSGTDSEAAKEEAGLLYKKEMYRDAKRLYLAAIRSNKSKDKYADILRNVSACIPDELHLCASVVLANLCVNPLSEKSIYRLSNSLVQLRLDSPAMSLCQTGLNVFRLSAALLELKDKIDVVQSSGTKQSETRHPKNFEKHMEDVLYGKAKSSTLEQTKAFNNLRDVLPLLAGKGNSSAAGYEKLREMAISFRAVPFHLEYKKAKLLPSHCDPALCYRMLEEGFENAKCYKMHDFYLTEVFHVNLISLKRLTIPLCFRG